MANTNAPFGFRAVRRLDGAVPNFATRTYEIAYNNSTKIRKGDAVKLLTTGYIDLAAASDTSLLGVLDGVEYYDVVQAKKVFFNGWLAPTTTALAGSVKARVIVDPMAVYAVQSNGAALTLANIGENIKLVAGTGNDLTGISGAAVDQTTLNTTNTIPFRIVGLSEQGTNDNASSYNVVEVIIVGNHFTNLTGLA